MALRPKEEKGANLRFRYELELGLIEPQITKDFIAILAKYKALNEAELYAFGGQKQTWLFHGILEDYFSRKKFKQRPLRKNWTPKFPDPPKRKPKANIEFVGNDAGAFGGGRPIPSIHGGDGDIYLPEDQSKPFYHDKANLIARFPGYKPHFSIISEADFETVWSLWEEFLSFLDRYFASETDWLISYFLDGLDFWTRYNGNKHSLDVVCKKCGKQHGLGPIQMSYSEMVWSGEEFTFHFSFDGWEPTIKDRRDYEKTLRKALREAGDAQIKEYVNATMKAAKVAGYKQRGRKDGASNVKWLVIWNLEKMTKAEILDAIKKQRPSNMTEDDLNEIFRKLEGYGLPYRRKRGKSFSIK